MSPKELRNYQEEMKRILLEPSVVENKSREIRLRDLAEKIGVCCRKDEGYSAGPAELANRIVQALQTASMINMAETAARSYWIALVASLIALLSAAAAWVAVFVQIIGNMKQLFL